MAEIWERQKNESNKAYHIFCIYRDLGRSKKVKELAQEYPK
jgi:hypothetical protein